MLVKIESIFHRVKDNLMNQMDDEWKIKRLERLHLDVYTVDTFINTFPLTPEVAVLRFANYVYRRIFPIVEDDRFALELIKDEMALMKEELLSIYERYVEIPVSNLIKHIERREEKERIQ